MGSSSQDPDPSRRIQRPSDRPLRRRAIVQDAEHHVRELGALAELMLGAAWADGTKLAVEVVAIAEQLKSFVDAPTLPEHVSQLMERFDPKTFDVAQACARLTFSDDNDRVGVLSLLARVSGADRVLHPDEELYLQKVAALIGLDPTTLRIRIEGDEGRTE